MNVLVKIDENIFYRFCSSMALCKTAVTPLLTHWSYCSLALSHRVVVWAYSRFWSPLIFTVAATICSIIPILIVTPDCVIHWLKIVRVKFDDDIYKFLSGHHILTYIFRAPVTFIRAKFVKICSVSPSFKSECFIVWNNACAKLDDDIYNGCSVIMRTYTPLQTNM